MKLLEIKDISKEFGSKKSTFIKTALKNISIDIEKGEFTGIMGPSGAGKTTLLNMISTIDKPTSGEILIDGESIIKLKGNKLSDFRRDKLGFIFQEHNLLDTLTIRENIILPLSLQKIDPIKAREKVIEISNDLGIEDILDKYPVENSGGQRQRTAIARAIIGSPSLILADEPTGALDSKNSRALMSTLVNIQKKRNSTIVLVSHDPMVSSYCNRIIFIKDGELFSEIRKEGNRKSFYKKIIDVLSAMEGVEDEVFHHSMA